MRKYQFIGFMRKYQFIGFMPINQFIGFMPKNQFIRFMRKYQSIGFMRKYHFIDFMCKHQRYKLPILLTNTSKLLSAFSLFTFPQDLIIESIRERSHSVVPLIFFKAANNGKIIKEVQDNCIQPVVDTQSPLYIYISAAHLSGVARNKGEK